MDSKSDLIISEHPVDLGRVCKLLNELIEWDGLQLHPHVLANLSLYGLEEPDVLVVVAEHSVVQEVSLSLPWMEQGYQDVIPGIVLVFILKVTDHQCVLFIIVLET